MSADTTPPVRRGLAVTLLVLGALAVVCGIWGAIIVDSAVDAVQQTADCMSTERLAHC